MALNPCGLCAVGKSPRTLPNPIMPSAQGSVPEGLMALDLDMLRLTVPSLKELEPLQTLSHLRRRCQCRRV